MASNQPNNNIFGNKPIKIEIADAGPIYLPIPKQELGFSFVFLCIEIKILNQTDSTIYLDPHATFLSEMYSSENEYIRRNSMIFNPEKVKRETNKFISFIQFVQEIFLNISSVFNKNGIDSTFEIIDYELFDYVKISPKRSENIIFALRRLPHRDNFSIISPTTPEYYSSYQDIRQFCVFENLRSGEYTLKFVYIPMRSQKLEKLKEKNADIIDSEESIKSSSMKINLIHPQKEEPNTLTTPDIKFQVFIAGENEIKSSKIIKQMNLWEFLISRLPRSSSHPKPSIVLPLCFRIINESSKPYRFDFYNFSTPDFIYNGTLIDWEVVASPLRILYGKSEDYPIVMPNESIDFYPDLVIFLSGWNQFRLSVFCRNECHLISESIKPGQYHVCFNYYSQNKSTYAYDAETQQTPLLEDFWVGSISTPFININLSPP